MSIHDAKIITSKGRYTANTFVILDKQGKSISDSYRALDIAQSLTEALSNPKFEIAIRPTTQRLKQFNITTQVSFIESVNKNRTLLEIVALDSPGLLAKFAKIFIACEITIHSAKITTFGEKAEDVFTISNKDKQALTQEQQQILSQKLCEDI